jgi:hypothetical protein
MHIPVNYLLAQGSGQNAFKFYIAVADGAANFTINGANTPNGSGQVNELASAGAVATKLRQKLKEYHRVGYDRINPAAMNTLAQTLQRLRPELRGLKYKFNDNGVDFETGVAAADKASTSSRPKSAKKIVHDWF